ncbi:hypothetical protein QBC38DRAFT_455704 [Podospora fimiseda]|uniref:RNA polymerase II assembly factor Rtp1 C-terminal domain-containing protein n=1 Tax=Podospora fimiseda TaxID=252190 RepID=A0AAN7H1T3_9PEZI|nr:hypothetical protein QBC38DRAFT_455704 [Podospora fimiseda]
MDKPASEMNARQKLIHNITELGKKAFNPESSEQSRAEGKREFDGFIQRTKTLNVLGALSMLTRPGHLPPWLRPKFLQILSLVPLRENAVRPTMEFVFALHPSSTIKTSEAAVPQKKGANITHEALQMATNLLAAPPASVTPEKWYSGIGPQLLTLLDGEEGPELTRAASYIIGFGILGRKASGAPGTAGWKYLAEPLLHGIKPLPNSSSEMTEDEVIDLSKPKVIVKHDELVTSLRRLHALTVSHPNPGLCKRLLSPLLLSFLALGTWKDTKPALTKAICAPALELLKIHMKLAPSPDLILFLVGGLGYNGGLNRKNPEWIYQQTTEEEISIVDTKQRFGVQADVSQISLDDIDTKTTNLLGLISSNFSDSDISIAFLELLKRWLKSTRKITEPTNIIIKQEEETQQDPFVQVIELKVLQAMMEKFPDKFSTQPKAILALVSEILSSSSDDDDDEIISVALSLLNMIITVPGFQKSRVKPEILSSIESSLDRLSKYNSETSKTANNLRLLLLYRDELDDNQSSESITPAGPTDRQIEDRKTYSLAVSYITNSSNLPPVRVEGLSLISSLINSKSPILDVPGILALLSTLISDSEEYVFHKAISTYILLASSHPKAVTTELLDQFIDQKERKSSDERLRFAEALSQVIERLGQTFTGPLAKHVGEGLLQVAGRRGYRPKTKEKQEREAKVQEQKNKEADEAWGGKVPNFSDEMSREEKERNEILERIVEGWESKKGEEDIRIRASALAVLRSSLEVNMLGLGVGVVNGAVEVCLGVLRGERELEKGILRRAAVLLVMGFVDGVRGKEEVGRMGFGRKARGDLLGVLRYVRETDEDGLVRRHAGDVVESLENWEVGRFVGSVEEGGLRLGGLGGGLTGGLSGGLRGLVVNPERRIIEEVEEVEDQGGKVRPRIEEIE